MAAGGAARKDMEREREELEEDEEGLQEEEEADSASEVSSALSDEASGAESSENDEVELATAVSRDTARLLSGPHCTAVASTSNGVRREAARAVDGDDGTWWSSYPVVVPQKHEEWLEVDLRGEYLLHRVEVTWVGDDYARTYVLQGRLHPDAGKVSNFVMAREDKGHEGMVETLLATGSKARFVRVACLESAHNAFKVRHFDVYGVDSVHFTGKSPDAVPPARKPKIPPPPPVPIMPRRRRSDKEDYRIDYSDNRIMSWYDYLTRWEEEYPVIDIEQEWERLQQVPENTPEVNDVRLQYRCRGRDCNFFVSPRPTLGSYCCLQCFERKPGTARHGPRCLTDVAGKEVELYPWIELPLYDYEIKDIEYDEALQATEADSMPSGSSQNQRPRSSNIDPADFGSQAPPDAAIWEVTGASVGSSDNTLHVYRDKDPTSRKFAESGLKVGALVTVIKTWRFTDSDGSVTRMVHFQLYSSSPQDGPSTGWATFSTGARQNFTRRRDLEGTRTGSGSSSGFAARPASGRSAAQQPAPGQRQSSSSTGAWDGGSSAGSTSGSVARPAPGSSARQSGSAGARQAASGFRSATDTAGAAASATLPPRSSFAVGALARATARPAPHGTSGSSAAAGGRPGGARSSAAQPAARAPPSPAQSTASAPSEARLRERGRGSLDEDARQLRAPRAVDGTLTSDLARGRPARASTERSLEKVARNAVDGRPDTRWTSDYEDNQWLWVDLGSEALIRRVEIRWEAAYAARYDVLGSVDNQTWLPLASEVGRDGWVTTRCPEGSVARYVVVFCRVRAMPEYGFSIWELRVLGAGGAAAAPRAGAPAEGNEDAQPPAVTAAAAPAAAAASRPAAVAQAAASGAHRPAAGGDDAPARSSGEDHDTPGGMEDDTDELLQRALYLSLSER